VFIGDVVDALADSSNDVTISGGEPLDQFDDLLELCRMLSESGKHIWLYTGNVVDPTKNVYIQLARYVDVIVDGRFVEDKKDCNLLFRGSSNQRLINLPLSVVLGEIIEWEDK
jgi:anaerobic ribonucleoside-triphosphate reductase activating protein